MTTSQEDIDFEREKSASEDEVEGIPTRHFSDSYLEELAVYRKIAEKMIDYDTILFHGSVIAVDGIGYLFTAKSGTGKSTHIGITKLMTCPKKPEISGFFCYPNLENFTLIFIDDIGPF